MIRTTSRVDQRYDGAGPGRSMLAFRSVVSVLVPRGLTGNQQPFRRWEEAVEEQPISPLAVGMSTP